MIVSAKLQPKVARCRIEKGGATKIDASVVHARIVRLLGLVIDPRPFARRASRQADIARLIRGREGLTVPQTATVFDALIWVIAGQQVSLPVAFAPAPSVGASSRVSLWVTGSTLRRRRKRSLSSSTTISMRSAGRVARQSTFSTLRERWSMEVSFLRR